MFYNGKNLLIKINGNEIIATEATLNYEAQISPYFEIGDRYTKRISATDLIQGSLNLNYLFTGADYIKSLRDEDSHLIFDFGGISQTGYLRSHSTRINPHNPISCAAEIVFYQKPTGNFTPTYSNIDLSTRIVHADNLVIYDFNNKYITGDYINATFNYRADIRPEYAIGDIAERRGVFGIKESTLTASFNNLNTELELSGISNVGLIIAAKDFGGNLFKDAFSITGFLTSKSFRATTEENLLTEINIRQYEILAEAEISGFLPSTVRIGDTLTISGSNFQYVIAVILDNLDSVFEIKGPGELEVIVPRLKTRDPAITLLTPA